MSKTCTYCPSLGVAYIDGKLVCAQCCIAHAPPKKPRAEIQVPERRPEETHRLRPRMPQNMFIGRRRPTNVKK